MYTLKFLAPILVSICAHEFINNDGDYCVVDKSQPNIVKYYESGKSCYVNGTFYRKCEEANGSI